MEEKKMVMKSVRGGAPSLFAVIDDSKKVFMNWKGTLIKRAKFGVGKGIGGGIYVHKQYAGDVMPKDVLEVAGRILREKHPEFEYNCLHWNLGKQHLVRFDEAPDFDTASEPVPGKMITVDTRSGVCKMSSSASIWHHKWMWVRDDYDGFDVEESYEWSKRWSREISSPSGSRKKWEEELRCAGLERTLGEREA